MHITDPADTRLDDFRNLKRNVRDGLVIAEGPLVMGRLLTSRFPVRRIVGFPDNVEAFLAENPVGEEVEVYTLDRETLAQVAGYDMHRGLLASADRAKPLSVAQAIDGARTVAVLEGVGDHENIGSLFRNAAGLGVGAVLLGAGCADPLYRRVVRVSMGHVLRVPFAQLGRRPTTWQHDLSVLQARGYRVVAMTPNTGHTLADAVAGADKVAVMVGAEGPGLTEHAMRAADVRAKIPMSPGTDSLNVATSAAIGFYAAQY